MASWIGNDIDIKKVLLLGFITSPLEFSHSERQRLGLTRPVADALLQSQTQPHNKIEDQRDLGVSPVVMNQAAGEESSEPSQGAQDDTAVDPPVSFEPITKR